MEPILDTDRMREVDRLTIQELLNGNGMLLMEHAGTACVRVLQDMFGERLADLTVCVAAGCGNNGGDGMVIARQLVTLGVDVSLFLVGEPNRLSDDAALQWEILKNYPVAIHEVTDTSLEEAILQMQSCSVFVDAMLGTGLQSEPRGLIKTVIDGMAGAVSSFILAVDIPSGLPTDGQSPAGSCIRANCTVTFGCRKPCHVFSPAESFCGHVLVDDITIPDWIVSRVSPDLFVPGPEDIRSFLPPLAPDAHKGTSGHLGVIAGERGKLGAAVMAAAGGLYTGAGLSTIHISTEDYPLVSGMVPELMFDCADDPFQQDVLASFCSRMDVVVVGPGFGTGKGARARLESLLDTLAKPVVADADVFHLLEPAELAALLKCNAVLTPHPGELADFLKTTTAAVQADRLGAARQAAAATGHVVVLKGQGTIVAMPDGRAFLNSTGNPGMGTAGSGDVLSGMIGALLAQGKSPEEAAVAGVYIHGMAGDMARDLESERSVTAMKIAAQIGPALGRLLGAT